MNSFNEIEFKEICQRFKANPRIEEVTINYSSRDFFDRVRNAVLTDRRGEVVFCVIRSNGRIITITCNEYPKGIFRIPTGGIGHNEDIVEGVFRETREELGLEVEIIKFAGVIKIRFVYKDEEEMFYSYLFILREKSGNLLIDAIDDEVSEVREVSAEELKETALSLGRIEGEWRDWGKFRFVTTDAVYRIIKEEVLF